MTQTGHDHRDEHCCDCSRPLPDPGSRNLINGGALCNSCRIAREIEIEDGLVSQRTRRA
jgi:hypothetical protein